MFQQPQNIICVKFVLAVIRHTRRCKQTRDGKRLLVKLYIFIECTAYNGELYQLHICIQTSKGSIVSSSKHIEFKIMVFRVVVYTSM